MKTLNPGTVIQVQDGAERWHAAQLGVGLFCPLAAEDVSGREYRWELGSARVDCPACQRRMRELETGAASLAVNIEHLARDLAESRSGEGEKP